MTPKHPKSQQLSGAIIFLLVLAAIYVGSIAIGTRGFRVLSRPEDPKREAVNDSMAKATADSLWQAKGRKKHPKRPTWRDSLPERQMQLFDPNTADSLTLLRVGFLPWNAHSLLRYRAKGGRFRRPEDVRKLYNLPDSIYERVQPWIDIDTTLLSQPDTLPRLSPYKGHIKRDTLIGINAADTGSLQYLRGIGPYYARQVVRRREQLGGYVRLEQLREIEGFPYDSVLSHLYLDTIAIRQIRVATARRGELVRHPYISYEQAVAIDDLRHRRSIRGREDLLRAKIFTEEEIARLLPYLSF